jgi:hypothetical protein
MAALAAASVLSASLPAAAAGDLVVAEAKQRMAEGKDLYGAGQYEAAWLKYKQACVVIKSDNCTRGLAFTEFKSKRWLDAYQHMRELLLPAPKPSLTPSMTEELTRMMHEAYARTGHIAVRADAGATLTLDGAFLQSLPTEPIDVAPGTHVLEASRMDRTRRIEVNVAEGALVDADVTIAAASESPPVVQVPISEPAGGSTGRPIGGPEARMQNGAEPGFWSTRRALGAVLGGVGAVSLGVGIALQIVRSSDASSAASIRATLPPGACGGTGGGGSQCQALDSAYSAQTRDADLSTATLIGGGVALAAGAALFLWPRSKALQVSAVPQVSPRFVGLELRGGL